MSFLRNLYPHRNFGLLVLRIGIGFMFMVHGWPKITGGAEKWEMVGSAMGNLGIDFGHAFFGFMAAFSETIGGLFLMLGLMFRPTTLLLFITMVVAALRHYLGGDGFGGYSHAVEAAILFLGLYFIGPGRFSLDDKMFGSELNHRY
ncbi:DoxX family protein [Rufibacter roseus]|uniref:DoxX family protein n=1 Tax=Rufibacter roseus TaxID=1567108 RepID=A0ABW2DLD8_9BACT|nr:DoxX family protein [Rufibacter roseus]